MGSGTCGRWARGGLVAGRRIRGRSSPRAPTSTPCPMAGATTGRWGRCWDSRSPPSWAPGAGTAHLRRRGGAALRRRDDGLSPDGGHALRVETLVHLHDSDGVSAAEARAAYLEELGDLPRIAPPVDRLRAHAEVHVAQRHALRELGVVTAVASPRRFSVRIDGRGGPLGRGVDGRSPRRAGGGGGGRARRRGRSSRRARRDGRHRWHPGRRAGCGERHPRPRPPRHRRARHRVRVARARGVGHPGVGGGDRCPARGDGGA